MGRTPAIRRSPSPLTLLAALTLGAMTTVAIAWALAWKWPDLSLRPRKFFAEASHRIPPPDPGIAPLWWWVRIAAAEGVTVKQFYVESEHAARGSNLPGSFEAFASDAASVAGMQRHEYLVDHKAPWIVHFGVSTYGWPVPCMACEHSFTAADARLGGVLASAAATNPDGLSTPSLPPTLEEWHSTVHIRGHALPLCPLPGPFAVCVSLYSALCLLLILIVRAVPRWSRRGHCQACRYNLAGLPHGAPCPECGAPQGEPAPKSPSSGAA